MGVEFQIAFLSLFASWISYVTLKLNSIDRSVKFINKNLYFVDWNKVPSKSLNEVFKNE